MSGDIDLRAMAARLVRQSLDMGETEWFLDGLDRERAMALVRAAKRAPGTPAATAPEATGQAAARAAEPSVAEPAPDRAAARSLAEMVREEIDRSNEASRPAASGAAGDRQTSSPESKPAARGDLPVLPDDHDGLRDLALGCTRCGLSESRTQVVFADGAPDARLMVVGEAPGANEDETGIPFVGAAGKFLDLLLATVDLSREESVYICNVLKCRPPGNRNPEAREIETCSPYLLKQIEIVQPRAILAVGSFSAQLLTGREKTALGKLRGEVHSYQGVPLVVTYHPAALLRNANWTRAFWDDLQLLRDVMDEAG
ncbi:MAG: uracil-DNA glycosylase [Gemmatimonadota bacterium]